MTALTIVAAVFVVLWTVWAVADCTKTSRILEIWMRVDERSLRAERRVCEVERARRDADVWLRVAADAIGMDETRKRGYVVAREMEAKS